MVADVAVDVDVVDLGECPIVRGLSRSRDTDILLEGRCQVKVLRVTAWHSQLGAPEVRVLEAHTSSVLLAGGGILGLATRQLALVSTVDSRGTR